MSLPTLSQAPALHLGFAVLHLVCGQGVAAIVYRLRFGTFPLAVYRSQARTGPALAHQRISRAIGVLALAWGATLTTAALHPPLGEHWLGRPLLPACAGLGWFLAIIGLLAMVGSQLAMHAAFRVGIDASEAPTLARRGPFARSRNPIYLGSFTYLLGATLWAPGPLLLGLCLLIGALMHGLVRCEEAFLLERLGDPYRAYCAAVPRYFGWRA